jgi:hypothetical protein
MIRFFIDPTATYNEHAKYFITNLWRYIMKNITGTANN